MNHSGKKLSNNSEVKTPVREDSQSAEHTRNPEDSYVSEESQDEVDEDTMGLNAKKEVDPSVIRISRPFRTRWDICMMILAVYTSFTVPFFIAFTYEMGAGFIFLNTLIDIIFLLDIYLNFRTTYIDKSGEEVLDRKKIIRNYLTSSFPIDMVASFPIDNILLIMSAMSSGSEALRLTDIIKMLRILRLGRIIRLLRAKDEAKAMMKLVQLTLYVILWVHLTGCMWFLVVRDQEEWVPIPDFLTGTTELYEKDMWWQYFTSFYHGVWLLTGGEVGPRNSFQAFLASFFIIVGALITAVLFGEMAVLMENLNKRETQFQKTLDGAMTTMNNMKLGPELSNDIIDYLSLTQNSLSIQKEYVTFKSFISPSILRNVSACIYQPIIQKNCVFCYEDCRLQERLTHNLESKFTKPEENIVVEGDDSESLYFLVSGECKVFVHDKNQEIEEVCFLVPGAHFGEIGVIYNTYRTATVQGIDYCNVAELKKKDYNSLLATYPHLDQKLRSGTENYDDRYKNFLRNSLLQANYLSSLSKPQLNNLLYSMRIFQLEKNEYLFRPGEPANQIYLLADGELELSITINEQHIQILKREEGHLDLEGWPKIAKPNRRKKALTLSDFEDYNFNLNLLNELKPKAEIIPVMDENTIVNYMYPSGDPPEGLEPIGGYPQEIKLADLEQGTLLNHRLILAPGSLHQLQCKTTRNSTIYALTAKQIESFARENADLREELTIEKGNLKSVERPLATNHLDYMVFHPGNEYEQRWKGLIVSFIIHFREQKRKSSTQISVMVTKLQAVIACEEAGNYELSTQVISGAIPAHHIKSDGTLDPSAGLSEYRSLPKSHPMMKNIRKITDGIAYPNGELVKNYAKIRSDIQARTHKMLELYDELLILREKIRNAKAKGLLVRRQPEQRSNEEFQKKEESKKIGLRRKEDSREISKREENRGIGRREDSRGRRISKGEEIEISKREEINISKREDSRVISKREESRGIEISKRDDSRVVSKREESREISRREDSRGRRISKGEEIGISKGEEIGISKGEEIGISRRIGTTNRELRRHEDSILMPDNRRNLSRGSFRESQPLGKSDDKMIRNIIEPRRDLKRTSPRRKPRDSSTPHQRSEHYPEPPRSFMERPFIPKLSKSAWEEESPLPVDKEVLKLDVQKVYEIQEERRKRREARKEHQSPERPGQRVRSSNTQQKQGGLLQFIRK